LTTPVRTVRALLRASAIINYDTRLRQGFGGQVKYRLGRDGGEEEERGSQAGPSKAFRPGSGACS